MGSVSRRSAAPMNCDRLAPYYETLERLAFGSYLEQTRLTFLAEVGGAERAVLCGDGDGRFLAALLRANPRVQVDFVDLSGRMIEIAQRRVVKMGPSFRERVRFFVGDAREFQPQASGYDLIATHFFLDCFSQAEIMEVVTRIASWAAPGAQWMVSEFRETETLLGRVCTRAVIRGLYAAFRFSTGLRVTRLPDYTAALAKEGFSLRCETKKLAGLLESSLWEVRATDRMDGASHPQRSSLTVTASEPPPSGWNFAP
jgi:ubiquinone/menaquinone biosynthesis C-methylase UbiE